MKVICLALLLANLLFFGWSHWIVQPKLATPAASTTSVPRLVLANEINGASSQAPSSAKPSPIDHGGDDSQSDQPVSSANGMKCSSVGPFQDVGSATRAAASFRGKAYDPHIRVVEGDLRAGLWVHVENLTTRDAQQAMSALKQHGIADAYLMPSDRPTAEISVGIFSESARAQRRAEEVRALGFKPTITDRRKGASYWLDIELKPGDSPVDPAVIQNGEDKSGKIVRLDVIACPQQP